MRVDRLDVPRGFRLPPIAAVAVLALVSGLAAVLDGRAQLALHACLPGDGPVGWLGLRLALLRSSVDCPDGALALGGSTSRSALVVVSVAVPVLLAHVVAAVCGASLSALATRAASGLRAVLAAVWPRLPGRPRVGGVHRVEVIGQDRSVVPWCCGDPTHPDRGPPALLAC